MSFLINPFAFAVAGGDFEAISSVTVGSGGASSIEFTSIPSTFAHLQVRLIGRSTYASQMRQFSIRLNGVSTSSYSSHQLYGDGSGAYGNGASSQTSVYAGNCFGASISSSIFSAAIIDILDYSSTSKNTTIRAFAGSDSNSVQGNVFVSSGLYINTAAIAGFQIYPDLGNFAQYSTAALYGVKAP